MIALDRALEQAKEGVVDVMGIVNDMRQQRMKMVQTLVKYVVGIEQMDTMSCICLQTLPILYHAC